MLIRLYEMLIFLVSSVISPSSLTAIGDFDIYTLLLPHLPEERLVENSISVVLRLCMIDIVIIIHTLIQLTTGAYLLSSQVSLKICIPPCALKYVLCFRKEPPSLPQGLKSSSQTKYIYMYPIFIIIGQLFILYCFKTNSKNNRLALIWHQ